MRSVLERALTATRTVEPAEAASAVRVNTEERRFVPSITEGVTRVQPAGVVCVAAVLVEATRTMTSPDCTLLGTTTEAEVVLASLGTPARKVGGVGACSLTET